MNETMISALDAIVWYNGLGEYITAWSKLPKRGKEPFQYLECPFEIPNKEIWEQLEIVWMFCVLLFGDYGTSPRSGWIEKIDEFNNFIQQITEIYRNAD